MASPFSKAWNLLKYFKNPHDEEEATYGSVSYRNHPLFGQPGYEGSSRDQPTEREMAEMGDPSMIEDSVDAMEMAPLARRSPPPIGIRGSMNPDMAADLAEREIALNQIQMEEREPPKAGDTSRPQTIPMSPRGSVRGRGEKQATAKPKTQDWWRTLSGEE